MSIPHLRLGRREACALAFARLQRHASAALSPFLWTSVLALEVESEAARVDYMKNLSGGGVYADAITHFGVELDVYVAFNVLRHLRVSAYRVLGFDPLSDDAATFLERVEAALSTRNIVQHGGGNASQVRCAGTMGCPWAGIGGCRWRVDAGPHGHGGSVPTARCS